MLAYIRHFFPSNRENDTVKNTQQQVWQIIHPLLSQPECVPPLGHGNDAQYYSN